MPEEKETIDHGWQTLSSRIAYKNPWMQVREDQIIRPDGSKGMYGIVETTGPSVFIVALTEKKEIHLIHQYRYPIALYSWELPAGGSEGKDPLQAAKKELQEETGLIAANWRQIGTFQALNGLCNEISFVFLAQGLTQTNKNEQLEEGIIDVKKVPLTETLKMIKDGRLIDSQTIASISQTVLYLEGKI